TNSMFRAVEETNRRRSIQEAYNIEHNITPTTIYKEIRNTLDTFAEIVEEEGISTGKRPGEKRTLKDEIGAMKPTELAKIVSRLEREMKKAAQSLDFEQAAELRDLMIYAKGRLTE
ncbi:MAG: excinuclease ABC subunit B, partial [Clostridiaceae bacterium]|nr:excinuclease ABC subunit B [Clostridiaceae bacterium]